jgi:hypothetical protein
MRLLGVDALLKPIVDQPLETLSTADLLNVNAAVIWLLVMLSFADASFQPLVQPSSGHGSHLPSLIIALYYH